MWKDNSDLYEERPAPLLMEIENIVAGLQSSYPGREDLLIQLTTLFTTTAPPSIHVHSPFSPRPTASLVRSVLDATGTSYASIHGAECLSQRLFFDRVLGSLAAWRVRWRDGCEAYGGGRYSGNVDGFVEGLRAIARQRHGAGGEKAGKDKEKEKEKEKMVVIIESAERFKENLPELMVPLTRMVELSRLPFTAIFISEVSWFDLRPSYGAAIDPFIIQVSHLNSQDAVEMLVSLFPKHQTTSITPYSSALTPLYAYYASALYSVCSPFLVDEHELAYIAAACWPNFVSPLLADWVAQTSSASTSAYTEDDPNDTTTMVQDPPPSTPLSLPSEEARMRLVRYFTPSFTHALQTLYPRHQHASQWSKEYAPPPDLRLSDLLTDASQTTQHPQNTLTSQNSQSRDTGRSDRDRDRDRESGKELTTIAKYVLVAAFLASFNPAKTDVRLLGRTPDARGKRRRGGARKSRGGGRAKVSQRLLGPSAFPVDRLLAILGSLMEEHDQDVPKLSQSSHGNYDDADDGMEKDTEMAVGRIQVSATISELVAMRLLHRTTPPERIDGPLAFKCGISQARAFELARDVGIGSLADLLWDAN